LMSKDLLEESNLSLSLSCVDIMCARIVIEMG
jgi:hypothetical protein